MNIPKSPRISFPRIRLANGNVVKFSHTNRPKTSPFPCTTETPFNTAMPRPTTGTTPNRSSDGWGTVTHVRRKVPTGYNGVPQIRPRKYPFPWTNPQTPLPESSLDLSDLWYQTASGCDPPCFLNALDKPTDAHTNRLTDLPRESLTTIGCCASNKSDEA